ncbi:hypothetical protein CHARACLAT_027829, partial [Characodon lateralis]|nr:hypothetical protein [Characodon lateralis]
MFPARSSERPPARREDARRNEPFSRLLILVWLVLRKEAESRQEQKKRIQQVFSSYFTAALNVDTLDICEQRLGT